CAWRGPPLVGSSESGWWSAPVAAHGVVLLWFAEGRAVGGQPQSLRMAWSFLLVVGGVGWWSAPVAAHGVVLSPGGRRGGLVVSPSRCAWRGPFSWWSAGWVGGQPQSLRMAWSFLLVVGGGGWWSAPVAAHGVVLSPGGRRGGLVVSPSRCAWRGPFSWWSAGWVRGQPQSLRMAVPPLLLPCCGRIVTCDSEPATLTAGLALCDHVTSITYRP